MFYDDRLWVEVLEATFTLTFLVWERECAELPLSLETSTTLARAAASPIIVSVLAADVLLNTHHLCRSQRSSTTQALIDCNNNASPWPSDPEEVLDDLGRLCVKRKSLPFGRLGFKCLQNVSGYHVNDIHTRLLVILSMKCQTTMKHACNTFLQPPSRQGDVFKCLVMSEIQI